MTEPAPQNRAFYWSVLFFREFFRKGVTHVVISPGSRSTPLTLAAASHPGFDKQVVLDERSAAFLALGIGKATGVPAVLISTSGTALANYYPAVIESRLSGIPLILATADRPPHLRGTGANQAIDQLKIFGDYPVFFHEAGEPAFEENDLRRLTMLARQAVDLSVMQKGPVHLNFPFRKPLEPLPSFVSEVEKENAALAVNRNTDIHSAQPSPVPSPSAVKHLIAHAEQPLIITGPLSDSSATKTIQELANIIRAPVISEGGFTSPHNICGHEGFLCDVNIRQSLAPDLILRFGFQPTGNAVEQALKAWKEIPHVHFASSEAWHDATFSVSHRINWQELPVEWDVDCHTDDNWLKQWKSAEKHFTKKLQSLLMEESALTDLHVYHYLTPQIREQWNVFISNSFPVRDSLLAGRYQTPSVYVNRGASGIDGITSTAMGVNLGLNQPTVLFTGDLAFLHDTNALLSSNLLKQPMIIIVLNNRGGNVFRMLPIAEHESYYTDYFETPQSAEISGMPVTYGVSHSEINSIKALASLDLVETAHIVGKGIHLIECKTHSEASMRLRQTLWDASYAT